jgi:hypothetical protein
MTAGQPNGRFVVVECIRPAGACPDHVDADPDTAANVEDVLSANNGVAVITWHQAQLETGDMINLVDSVSPPMIQTEPVPQPTPAQTAAEPQVNVSMLNLMVVPSRRQGEAYPDCLVRLYRAGGLLTAANIGRLTICLQRAAMLSLPEIPGGPLFGVPVSVFATASCIASGTGALIGDVIRVLVNCAGLETPVTLPEGGSGDPVPAGG